MVNTYKIVISKLSNNDLCRSTLGVTSDSNTREVSWIPALNCRIVGIPVRCRSFLLTRTAA